MTRTIGSQPQGIRETRLPQLTGARSIGPPVSPPGGGAFFVRLTEQYLLAVQGSAASVFGRDGERLQTSGCRLEAPPHIGTQR